MSSLKKYVPQRTYRERGQPERRRKRGMLEKHKDYVLRAKDYHGKERRLHALLEKSRQRNPDEFYFNMINSRVEDGIHRHLEDDVTESRSLEKLRLEYVIVCSKIVHERSRIEALKSESHFTELAKPNRHIFFVDSNSSNDSEITGELSETSTALLGQFSSWQKGSIKRSEKELYRKYEELLSRIQREQKLKELLRSLEVQQRLAKKQKNRRSSNAASTSDNRVFSSFWKRERNK
eukprot:jgi/Galph1/856/GphlegSOOS_G5593.1